MANGLRSSPASAAWCWTMNSLSRSISSRSWKPPARRVTSVSTAAEALDGFEQGVDNSISPCSISSWATPPATAWRSPRCWRSGARPSSFSPACAPTKSEPAICRRPVVEKPYQAPMLIEALRQGAGREVALSVPVARSSARGSTLRPTSAAAVARPCVSATDTRSVTPRKPPVYPVPCFSLLGRPVAVSPSQPSTPCARRRRLNATACRFVASNSADRSTTPSKWSILPTGWPSEPTTSMCTPDVIRLRHAAPALPFEALTFTAQSLRGSRAMRQDGADDPSR